MQCISRGPLLLLPALAALLAACGCGSNSSVSTGEPAAPLTVSAASSLTEAFEAYGEVLPGDQRFSFAGSDELAAQIRQGVEPDVFAAANTGLPEELAAEGLVEEPVVFAQNRLVIAVAPDSPIDSLEDLREPGTDLVLCAPGVPCGDYALEVLGKLPARERETRPSPRRSPSRRRSGCRPSCPPSPCLAARRRARGSCCRRRAAPA